MTDLAESIRLMEVAAAAARNAGEPLLAVFRSDVEYDYKRDRHDIVTEHDKASERRIVAEISTAVPDSAFVGEEGGRSGSGRVHWYIDPIDGTSNFARGIANWCVSIGAAIDGVTVAGAIYAPVSGQLFSAHLGAAFVDGKPIRARAAAREDRAMLLTGFPAPRHLKQFGTPALTTYAELIDTFFATRDLGSAALHLAHVAAGWADSAMGIGTNPWDVAAGAFILQQAGGSFSGFRAGEATTPGFLAPDYFATGAGADYPVLGAAIRRLAAAAVPRQAEAAGGVHA